MAKVKGLQVSASVGVCLLLLAGFIGLAAPWRDAVDPVAPLAPTATAPRNLPGVPTGIPTKKAAGIYGQMDGPLPVSLSTKLDSTNDAITSNAGPANVVAATMQNGATATGNGTTIALTGQGTVLFDVTISATATVTFEATTDATQAARWTAINALQVGTQSLGSTATATGVYKSNITGFAYARARISSYGSGTVTVLGWTQPQDSIGYAATFPGTISTGGLSSYHLISAANTNATNVKASAGQVFNIICSNINASPRYLHIYDKATTPSVGTDVPIWTLLIPGATSGGGLNASLPAGLQFSSGIGFGLSTGAADNDSGSVAAGDLTVNLGYR